MPVDCETRSKVRVATVSYLRGELRSDAYDDVVLDALCSTEDKSLVVISRFLWGTYSDLVNHFVSMSLLEWEMCQRIIAFLGTDLETEDTPDPTRGYWPFRNEDEWLEHMHLSCDDRLPAYDPTIHCHDVTPWFENKFLKMTFLVITILFYGTFLTGLFLAG